MLWNLLYQARLAAPGTPSAVGAAHGASAQSWLRLSQDCGCCCQRWSCSSGWKVSKWANVDFAWESLTKSLFSWELQLKSHDVMQSKIITYQCKHMAKSAHVVTYLWGCKRAGTFQAKPIGEGVSVWAFLKKHFLFTHNSAWECIPSSFL